MKKNTLILIASTLLLSEVAINSPSIARQGCCVDSYSDKSAPFFQSATKTGHIQNHATCRSYVLGSSSCVGSSCAAEATMPHGNSWCVDPTFDDLQNGTSCTVTSSMPCAACGPRGMHCKETVHHK